MKLLLLIIIFILLFNAFICYCALRVAAEEDRWLEEHINLTDQITQNHSKTL